MRGVRIETGYRQGMEVTPHYDPLLAKVIARGATRSQAIATLLEALGAFAIEGIRHNIPALQAILASEEFERGEVHTGLAMQVVGRTRVRGGSNERAGMSVN
jgi:acetyl-CoA carboxylase, biotin carboxylase subunit